jgi:hypothetical protein
MKTTATMTMKKTALSCAALLGSIAFAHGQVWTQTGQNIHGESAEDRSGSAISLSADGSIVAIGATGNDGNGSDAGHVRIFQNTAGTWAQLGQDIEGQAADDKFGNAVSLSGDGSRVAIGAKLNDGNGFENGQVRVYEDSAGTWTQIGQAINGEQALDHSGNSVHFSADGSVLAIGGYFNDDGGSNAGHVRVYRDSAGTWTQIGQDIDGLNDSDEFGWSVSLSDDGSVVAIGALNNDDNGFNAGHVRIFQDSAGTWTQVGQVLQGEGSEDNFGYSVSLSADGSIVAISATGSDSAGLDAGRVRIYQNSGGTWTAIGQAIDGEAEENKFGHAVSLSADGSMVAIGAIFNYDSGIETGHVRVFQDLVGTWTQIGQDIDGEAMNDQSGIAVSLSADGMTVAVGAHLNDGNGNNAGHVKVYEQTTGTSIADIKQKQLAVYPNPTNGLINFEMLDQPIQSIIVSNLNGKQVFAKTNLVQDTAIDLSTCEAGIYFISIRTANEMLTAKVIKE